MVFNGLISVVLVLLVVKFVFLVWIGNGSLLVMLELVLEGRRWGKEVGDGSEMEGRDFGGESGSGRDKVDVVNVFRW